MRGEVLHYDDDSGTGFISGVGGARYAFERGDLRRLVPISKGTLVEFQPAGDRAREIFTVRAEPISHAEAGGPQHFGRLAETAQPESTGLWGYFWRCMTANYVNFRGRARRKEYWGFVLFAMIAAIVLCGAGLAMDDAEGNLFGQQIPIYTIAALGILAIALIIPSIAVTVRRQHDIGLSGWFYLLVFLPYIGSIILFVFSLIPSQAHDNKWGPVPFGVRVRAPFTPPATGT